MTYDELFQGVVINTNRPELTQETAQAIKRATLKMHSLDYFQADLTEGRLSVTPSIQPRIDLQQFGPHLRKFAAISAVNSGVVSKPLKKIDPPVFGSQTKESGYFLLGGTLVLQNCGLVTGIVFQYYTLPLVATDSYNSWLALKHPYSIIDEASKTVFASVGNAEKAGFYSGLVGSKVPRPSGHIAEILSANPIGYDSAE